MTMSLAEFEAAARGRGFDEVLQRHWEAGQELGSHSHPFDTSALVVQGEMWLTVDGPERHLLPGDSFELARGTPHSERYGPQGATFWAARRHGPA